MNKENNFTNYWNSLLPLLKDDKKYYVVISVCNNGKKYIKGKGKNGKKTKIL